MTTSVNRWTLRGAMNLRVGVITKGMAPGLLPRNMRPLLMGNVPRVEAEVTFLTPEEGGRRSLPGAWGHYMPHLVTDDGEYLGVRFVAGPLPSPGVPDRFVLELMYHPEVCYERLRPGVPFAVREGGKVVGVGRVLASAADA
jgi:translation elongation factor EF-Tu-like GTPase